MVKDLDMKRDNVVFDVGLIHQDNIQSGTAITYEYDGVTGYLRGVIEGFDDLNGWDIDIFEIRKTLEETIEDENHTKISLLLNYLEYTNEAYDPEKKVCKRIEEVASDNSRVYLCNVEIR